MKNINAESRFAWKLAAALVVVFLLLLPGATSAFGQFGSASVIGYVHDNSGAVVPNATVALTNVATNVKVTGKSDKDGKFEFDSVPIGNYVVVTQMTGFEQTKTDAFNVATDARQRVDVTLQAGATDQVTVEAGAQLLETDTSSKSQVIGTREVENLPLNGRNYADLVLLAPGTRKSMLENQTASSRQDSFNINGQRSEFNEFILDGLENSNYGTSNQGFENENISPSPDAVDEFRVETSNYSAEYGRLPGAVINVQTRSGTNTLHGHVWDYLRNTNLNAVGPIEPITNQKPKLIRNQFGATAGGPILRDRAFFFADYEGIRQIFNYQLSPVTLPTANQRLGHFYYNDDPTKPIPLYNPITGITYTNGNISGASTAFGLGVLGALPANNIAGYTNNYSNAPRGTINDDKGDARLDGHFGKFQTFTRYSEHQGYIFDPPTVGGPAGGNANSNVYIKNRQIAGGVTWTISTNKLLDVRFAWTDNRGGKQPYLVGQPSLLTKYGITDGVPTDPSLVRPLNAQSVTAGFTQFGDQSSNPQFQWPKIWNPKVNYTWVKGKHSLKFGYEQQFIHTVVNDFNPSYGQDNYSSKFAAGPTVNGQPFFSVCAAGVSSTTGCNPAAASDTQIAEAQALADFLFGNQSSYSLTNYTIVNLRQRYLGAYVQDDFSLSPKLTVNMGLRYEIMTPQWEANNKLGNFDPATKTILQASNGSVYNRALVHTPEKNFAPRFGFSYAVDPKTAIRAGYGLVYVQYNREGGENNLTYNGPNVVNAAINNPTPFVTPVGSNLCTNDTQDQTKCFRQMQQGYAVGLTSPANFNPAAVTSRYIPPNFTTGYVQSYFVGVQHTLPHEILMDLSYVGSVGRHIQVLADYNQAAPCLLASVTACNAASQSYQARRAVPTFGDIEVSLPIGTSSYNALQLKTEKRKGALYLLNSLTWSRAFDIASGHLETGNGDNSRVNLTNPRNDYGPSSYDQPIDDTLSAVYDLPYGKGQHWGKDANGFMQQVLGGWQLTMINTMTSGLPFNITYSSSSSASDSSGPLYGTDLVTYRPQHVDGMPFRNPKSAWTKKDKYSGLSNYLPVNTTTPKVVYYNLPNYATYGNTSPYGNVSRNKFRGFGYYDTDFGLHKQFGLGTERLKLDFRAEVFNAFNVVNWQTPNTSISSGSSFGTIGSAFPARQMQFAGKIVF